MAENEVVRVIRVRGVPEGLENLTAQLHRAEQAYSGVGTAASTAGTATQTSASKLNTTERAYRSLTERLDSTARVYRQLQNDTRTLSGAFDAGFMGKGADAAARFNRELLQARQTLQDVGGRMATGNAGLDKAFGIGAAPANSARDSGAVFEEQAKSLQRLRQQYDPLGVAQERYASAVDETNKLLRAGQITETQHLTITTNAQKVLEDTTKSYHGAFTAQGKYASGAGLARHELINLSRQIQDVGVSLASGQSPLTVLIQQGTQIADVFAASRASVSSFLAQAAGGIGRFAMSGAGVLTGGALAGAGAAVAGYQYAESQRQVERALAGVGRQSGITVAQINRMSDAYADAAKVSTATGREMLAAFAGTGKIGAGLLPDTAALTKDFAAQFGLSATDAAKQLAGAFIDPTRGAQELNKQLGFLDAKTLEYIRTMQAQGRLGDAQRAMADALGQSVQGAADRTSGLARAWNAVWNAASGAWDAIGKAVAGQITLEERLAIAIERRGKSGLTSGYGARFSRGFDAAANAEIADVQEQIRRRNQQADRDARTAREKSASTGALSVLDELNPFGTELRKLETMASALKKGLEEAGAALSPDQARATAEAYERIQKAIHAALPPAERQKQLNDLTVQSIMARTVTERTAAEVARLQIDSAFKLKETDEQRLIILGKIAEMQAQANRSMQDAHRAAKDSASLAGLLSYQRALKQIEIDTRNRTEQYGVTGTSSALPASTAAANGLDNAFAASLKAMAAAIPGITTTSGFRTYEQQAKLYAEKPHLAAPPGRSQHEKGRAADLAFANEAARAEAHRRAGEFGLTFPLKDRARNPEPWHVEPIGGRRGGPANDNGGLNKATEDLAKYTLQVEQVAGPLRDANMALDAQIALADRQAQTMSMSTGEIAAAAEAQRLLNEYGRAGVPITDQLRAGIDAYAQRAGAAAEYIKSVGEAQKALGDLNSLGKDTLKGFISDIRAGKSGAEAFANALDKIASKLIDMAINDLFSKAFGGNGGSGLTSLLGGLFGGGGGGGLTPGSGGLYADGGYTGRGGKYDVAGLVHRDEFVFSKEATQRIGAGNLDAMHRGALKGYDTGGYVSPTPYVHSPANSNSASKVNVQVVNRTTGEVEGKATTKQNADGSIDVMLDLFEARLAGRVARGQGSLSTAMRAVGTNRQLWG